MERLSAWLQEWKIDGALAKPAFPLSFFYQEPPGEPLEPGQIRLLYPTTPAIADYPQYLAVLRRIKKPFFAVAPFSRFAQPAIPGEWLTGKTEAPIRVLCLWNQQRMREDQVRQSWVAGLLTEKELADARAVSKGWKTGHLPGHIAADRLGPPLIHPLDPRHDYLEEERLRMRQLVSTGPSKNTEAPLLAAESRPAYGARDLPLPLPQLKLRLGESGDTGIRLQIMSSTDEPSHQLDGWWLMNSEQILSDIIRAGEVRVSAAWITRPIFLCAPDGARYTLELPIHL